MYVMGALKLSVKLGITYEDAKSIVARWHKTFKKASSFTKHAAKVAETRGYVKTILGRRARFTDPRFSYRAANRIVQGGSSDILKYKLIELNRWIETNNLDDKIQMILNIHDSILFQIRDDSFSYIKDIQDIMENVQIEPFSLKVPFVAEYQEIGKNWAETTYGK